MTITVMGTQYMGKGPLSDLRIQAHRKLCIFLYSSTNQEDSLKLHFLSFVFSKLIMLLQLQQYPQWMLLLSTLLLPLIDMKITDLRQAE